MQANEDIEVVSFITVEDGDDLIVSFAIADDEPGEIASLILLRTPKYEALLPTVERGVHVSHESFPEVDDGDLLRRFTISGSVIRIETTRSHYDLDASAIDPGELAEARRILRKMNFDQSFILKFD